MNEHTGLLDVLISNTKVLLTARLKQNITVVLGAVG